MNRSFFAPALVALALAASSCTEGLNTGNGKTGITINAVAEGIGTKAENAYKYDILWQQGDRIFVKSESGSDTFTLSDGAGTTKGSFTQDSGTALSGTAEAFSPASLIKDGAPVWPAVQTAGQETPVYSRKVLSGSSSEDFAFSSPGAILQIVFGTPTADVILKSIEIKDGTKTLSGPFTVGSDGCAEITATDKAGITLDLGDGVPVGRAVQIFNIAIPAGKYEDLTLIFNPDEEHFPCEMHSSTLPELKRNTVCRIAISNVIFYPSIAIRGKFSVSPTKKVRFSPGNLRYSVTTEKWSFFENQYDCGSSSFSGHQNEISLFTWGYGSWSTNPETKEYLNKTGSLSTEQDWGYVFGNKGWRTLSVEECFYLFSYNGKFGNYDNDTRRGKYAYGVTVMGKDNCLILYPDGYAGEKVSNGNTSTYNDSVKWAEAQDAGVVCLPAAGIRSGSSLNSVGNTGGYWTTSSPGSQTDAFEVHFDYNNVYYTGGIVGRESGLSVRLVIDAN